MLWVVSPDSKIDLATQRVLASIDDEELAARYPDRTHFISVDNPHGDELVVAALREGDPVAIVCGDGNELLMWPRQDAVSGKAPPRVQVEARDATGSVIPAGSMLDAIPGAWERTQEGLDQATQGEGTPLDELA
jgi:hypothetical protein